MQPLKTLKLRKNEDRRLRAGHLWVYSNEIDTAHSPLKSFQSGEEVLVESADKTVLGVGYINPHSLIAVRLFTRNPSERFNTEFLIRRIQDALSIRSRLYPEPFYRLIFGESDGIPGLVVDRFNDTLVVQMNTAGVESHLDDVIAALQIVLPITSSILLKNDSPSRLQEGLETYVQAGLGEPHAVITLTENNTQFQVPIWTGQKTGWFYDHRYNRQNIIKYISGQRVLDVFSYLGGWGIQVAKQGSGEVTCVDASETACQLINTNARLNGIEGKVRVICQDAFNALKHLHESKEVFDVIILDPPAFVKKQKDIKAGLIAYQRINELALKILKTNGILISCSCSMHISFDDLAQTLRKAALRNGSHLQILERGHQAQDHPVHIAIPETDYLKMIVARKIGK